MFAWCCSGTRKARWVCPTYIVVSFVEMLQENVMLLLPLFDAGVASCEIAVVF